MGVGVGAKPPVGLGDGTLPFLYPPPHAQHMSAAVKSSSLYEDEHEDEYEGATDGDEHE